MIIPFFLPQEGCRQRCVFCNAHALADTEVPENKEAFCRKVEAYLQSNTAKKENEIAFYGANFTGISRQKQELLLGWAAPYLKKNLVTSIRISTRPDYLSSATITFLRDSGVATVEIGAQSLDDDVLIASGRGHSKRDVENALALLKASGIKTSLHLMLGLPHQSKASFLTSVDDVIKIKPDMVRLHPTLVFTNTPLATLYQSGAYAPLSLAAAIALSKEAAHKFIENGIEIIRLGLPISKPSALSALIAGPYHPSFGALVYKRLIIETTAEKLAQEIYRNQDVLVYASPKDGDVLRANSQAWLELFALKSLKIHTNDRQGRGTVTLKTGDEGCSRAALWR